MGKIEYRLVETERERQSAFALVWQRYRVSGILSEPSFQKRGDLETIVAVHRSRVVGTVSLAEDLGDGSLPLEDSFTGDELPVELAGIRSEGFSAVEVTCLAAAKGNTGIGLGLIAAALHHINASIVAFVLVAVSARHAAMYQRRLLFDPIGNAYYHPEHQRVDQVLMLDVRDHGAYLRRLAVKNRYVVRFERARAPVLV